MIRALQILSDVLCSIIATAGIVGTIWFFVCAWVP